MAPTLHLAMDFFAPHLMRPAKAPDDYGADGAFLHAIVQPVLLVNGQSGSGVGVREYLLNWDAARLAQEGLGFIGAVTAEKLRAGTIRPIPVPLPPGVEIEAEFSWQEHGAAVVSWRDVRRCGGTTDTGLPVVKWDQIPVDGADGWPRFAELTSSIPLVAAYLDLDGKGEGPEKELVRRWLVGLFSKIKELKDEGAAGPLLEPWESIWELDVKALVATTPLSNAKKWEEILHEDLGGKPRASHYYDRLLPAYAALRPGDADSEKEPFRSRPPRYSFHPSALTGRPDLFNGGADLAGRSYLHALWTELKARAAAGADKDLEDAVTRYFGFGERLAWPRARAGDLKQNKSLMVLNPHHPEAAEWLVTNGVSLCGQVLRLGPFDFGKDLASASCSAFKVAERDVVPDGADSAAEVIGRALREYHGGCRLSRPVPMKITPKPKTEYGAGGGSRDDRAVYWHSREAAAEHLVGKSVPAGYTDCFAVPGMLLDAVDPTARVESDKPGRLPRRQPVRQALRVAEVVGEADIQRRFATYVRIAARIEPYWLNGIPQPPTGDAVAAYAISLRDPLHPDESVVGTWLAASAAGTRLLPIELWVPEADASPKAFAVAGRAGNLLRLYPGAAAKIVVVDPPAADGSLGALAKLLAAAPGGAARRGSAHGWTIDILFQVAPGEPFNLLRDSGGTLGGRPLQIELAVGLVSRLSQTAERIIQSLAASWTPSFEPEGFSSDIQVNYAADSNKLRLEVERFFPESGRSLKLADPDALLPLPEDARPEGTPPDVKRVSKRPFNAAGTVSANGPQAWYWLAYHFDQDKDVGSSDEEAAKFQAWASAGARLAIGGYGEHQYGHRVPTETFETELRRGSDIVHPAEVHIQGLLAAELASGREPKALPRRRLVRLTEPKEEPGRFRIELGRKAVRLALEQFDRPVPDEKGAEGGGAGALRRIYKALVDLRDAVAAGTAQVRMEEWRYDASASDRRPTDVDLGEDRAPTTPDVAGNLVCSRQHHAPVQMPSGSLAAVFASLDQGFPAFVAALRAQVPPAAEDGDVGKDGWWAILHRTDPDPQIASRAHAVRVGLELHRPEAKTVDEAWVEAPFVPLRDPAAPHPPTVEQRLRTQAKAELRSYLSKQVPSRLRTRLGWIESADESPIPPMLIGEAGPQLLSPRDAAVGADAVADFFHVPFAFLVPDAHPALRDRQGTSDFATWLIRLLSALAAGAPVDTFLTLESQTPDEALRLRREAGLIITGDRGATPPRRGLIDRLDELFKRVEPEEPTSGSERERDLYRHVGRLLAELERLEEGQSWRQVRRALFARRPELFGDAMGIALNVFNFRTGESEPASFNHDALHDQLFDLTLHKSIELDDGSTRADVERFDVTHLHGDERRPQIRYFVDVLPAAVYDDTYRIEQTRFDHVPPTDFDALGEPRRASQVAQGGGGGAVARSAESVLDPDAAAPLLIANAVHYNPSWRYAEQSADDGAAKDAHFLYLLPERRLPPVPRVLPKVLLPDGSAATRSAVAVSEPAKRPDLKAQGGHEIGRVELEVASPSVPTGQGDSLRRYGRITGGAAHLPRWTAPEARHWHMLTTYVSHHWFEIELQRPDGTLRANLDDNAYEIDVEMWDGAPPGAPSDEAGEVDYSTPLLQWFEYTSKLRRGDPAGQTPKPVSRSALLHELNSWLVTPPDSAPYAMRSLLDPPSAPGRSAAAPSAKRSYRLLPPFAGQGWRLAAGGSGGADDVGAAVSVELYAPAAADGTVPRYDQVPSHPSVLLRLSILDHPFRISRSRVRIVRNWKDVNADNSPDIDNRFLLAEKYSTWTASPREALRVGRRELAKWKVDDESGGSIWVEPAEPGQRWLQRWLGGDPRVSADVAAALDRALKTTFSDAAGAPQHLWEWQPMQNVFDVSGAAIAPYEDVGHIFGLTGRVLLPPLSSRHESSARVLFPPASFTALLDAIRRLNPVDVGVVEPLFEFTWYDGERTAILTLELPMFVRTNAA